MSTAIHTLNDSLSWTCPIENRPAARRAIKGAATLGASALLTANGRPEVTDNVIRLHMDRAHKLRSEAIHQVLSGLFGKRTSSERVEL